MKTCFKHNNMEFIKKDTGDLQATLIVKIDEADYKERVDKALKELRKKANLKGFRPGHVPLGVIKKLYGKEVIADEVSKFLDEELKKYFKENNIDYIGDLLKSETEETKFDIEKEKDKDFQFAFDFGYFPEVDINPEELTIPYYKIKITDEQIDKDIENLKKQNGDFIEAEETDEETILYADITELNDDETPKEDGITVEHGLISIAHVAEDTKKQFIGLKKDDKIIVDIKKAFPNEADLAGLLKITKEELENINDKFEIKVNKIDKFKEAELNEELFKKVFPEDEIKTEEEFRQKVKEAIEKQFEFESKIRMRYDIKNILTEKIQIPLPEEFIVRWQKSRQNSTEEEIRKQLPMILDLVKWDRILDILGRKYNIKLEEQDLVEASKANIVNYLYQIGYSPAMFTDEQLNEFATNQLNSMNENDRYQLISETVERKILDGIKEKFPTEEKEITIEELTEIYKKDQEELNNKYKTDEEKEPENTENTEKEQKEETKDETEQVTEEKTEE